DVFAVGDVANVFDPLYGRRRRIEHWSDASYQGTEVGRILAGGDGGYDGVSSFLSEVFDDDQGLRRRRPIRLADDGRVAGRRLPRRLRARGPARRRRHGQSEELETLVK